MKKETFRVYLKDENNNMITFERFSCKRLQTVKNNMKILLDNSLYLVCVKNYKYIEYHKVFSLDDTELLEIIERK